jgi:carbon-monoxide dehydrogenase iron sulfur subunit
LEKILIQPELCDGCGDCEEACAKLHGASSIMVREVDGSYYPIICQHCEDAPCKIICPTEAIDEKLVDSDKCIGCSLCMLICPFGSVVMHERKAQKCNQCPDLDIPACIKACSKRAITLVDTEKIKLEKQTKHIEKMAGIDKKSKKKTGIVDVITHTTRAKDALK